MMTRENYKIRSACWHESLCAAQYMGDLKYIHHFGNKPDEIFNLKTDPFETQNVIGSFKEAAQWQKEVQTWYHNLEYLYQKHQDGAGQVAQRMVPNDTAEIH